MELMESMRRSRKERDPSTSTASLAPPMGNEKPRGDSSTTAPSLCAYFSLVSKRLLSEEKRICSITSNEEESVFAMKMLEIDVHEEIFAISNNKKEKRKIWLWRVLCIECVQVCMVVFLLRMVFVVRIIVFNRLDEKMKNWL